MHFGKRSILCAAAAVVAGLVGTSLATSPARAQGAVVTYDYRAAGERQDGELRHCATRARGVGGGNIVQSPVTGLGKTDPPDIFAIDPGEGVQFEFNELQTQITLALQTVTNSNGTGPSGEFTTEAFIENDVSIGTESFGGFGPFDISSRYTNTPIAKLSVIASDKISVGRISFLTNPGQSVGMRFDRLGQTVLPALVFCGLRIDGFDGDGTASIRLGTSSLTVDGQDNSRIDPGQGVRITFDNPTAAISVDIVNSADVDMNQTSGEGFITAFDEFGAATSPVQIADNGIKDVVALVGSGLYSAIEIEAIDAFQIRSVTHQPVPEPSAAALALGALGALAFRRRRAQVRPSDLWR